MLNANSCGPGPDWKIGQWRPQFCSRYIFLRPWNRQFFMGENFCAPEFPCVFRLSMAACLHSACLFDMYIVVFVFAPLAALEPAPGSDFLPLPLDLTAVAPPRCRRKLPNFPVWGQGCQSRNYGLKSHF